MVLELASLEKKKKEQDEEEERKMTTLDFFKLVFSASIKLSRNQMTYFTQEGQGFQ